MTTVVTTTTTTTTKKKDIGLRKGDVILLSEGLGVVRYYGYVHFDTGKYVGVEMRDAINKTANNNANNTSEWHNGYFQGRSYFKIANNNGLFVPVANVIRHLTPEEILQKLAHMYDIVRGRTSNSNFMLRSEYEQFLQQLKEQQQTIQQLQQRNEELINELSDIKHSKGNSVDSHSHSHSHSGGGHSHVNSNSNSNSNAVQNDENKENADDDDDSSDDSDSNYVTLEETPFDDTIVIDQKTEFENTAKLTKLKPENADADDEENPDEESDTVPSVNHALASELWSQNLSSSDSGDFHKNTNEETREKWKIMINNDDQKHEDKTERDVIEIEKHLQKYRSEWTENCIALAEIRSALDVKYKEHDFSIIQSSFCTKMGKPKTANQDSYFIYESFVIGGHDSDDVDNDSNDTNTFQFYGVCDGHGKAGDKLAQFVSHYLPKILSGQTFIQRNASSRSESDLTQTDWHFIPHLLLTKPKIALKLAFEVLEYLLTEILKHEKQSADDNDNDSKEDENADEEGDENGVQIENELNLTAVDINYSGTTVVCGLRIADKFYVANVGDSRAILGRFNSNTNKVLAIALSYDHDPKNAREILRIQNSKSGRILLEDDGDQRIEIELDSDDDDDDSDHGHGQLLQNKKRETAAKKKRKTPKKISSSVSRSIGDRMAHRFGGLSSEPEIIVHKLNKNDLFVVFASDGIWQLISNDDVMRMMGKKLLNAKEERVYPDLDKLTKKLVREANILWMDEYEDYIDDITVVFARIGKNVVDAQAVTV